MCRTSWPLEIADKVFHCHAKTTLEHYSKSVPESVRVAVESMDQLLKKKPSGAVQKRRRIEPNSTVDWLVWD